MAKLRRCASWPTASAAAVTARRYPHDAVAPVEELTRRTLVAVPARAERPAPARPRRRPLAVTDDGRGIAPLVVDGLREHGIDAELGRRVRTRPA
jgi:hypothetical protein